MKPSELHPRLQDARQFLLAQEFSRALPRYERLTRDFPAVAVLWLEYGNVASGLRNRKLADEAWSKAIHLAPKNSELIGLVGHQYQALRQPQKARACFAQAAAADPKAINPRISLAVLLEQQHQLGEARKAVEECLALDASDDQARYFSAVLDRRENKLESAERRLRELLASEPKHPYVRYASRYELAQILDRTEREDEAMTFLQQAKALVGELTDTDVLLEQYRKGADSALQFTTKLPKDILRSWGEAFPESKREKSANLAFLGGHPRSGTTLLEQVLDAHPQVVAVDESGAFLKVLQPEFHRSKELSPARLNTLRRLYLQALSEDAGAVVDSKLLVDKNPSPTARLPLWLKVFPELRVLVALRDPRDVILSCFFQNIPLNVTNVNFLRLETLAQHYSDLMTIWLRVRKWEGFSWLETRYESMVHDLEKEGRRVTEFLGLNWDERQARFHELSRKKQLYSPTYQDVTRPVYSRSVARWQAYEKHLAPIFPALQPFCREFGYA